MKNKINTGNPAPTAHVTVNKNRIKIYENNQCYLQNGQTFEIELFNPTLNKIKADIFLDGNNISEGGLVIKPGDRIYLERFVGTNNKFLYETYEVDDTEEVKNAIINNGRVSVKFYREDLSNIKLYGNNFQTTRTYITPSNPYIFNTNNTNTVIGSTTSSNPNVTFGVDAANTSDSTVYSFYSSEGVTSMETGRIEKGEVSNQTFEASYDSFSFYAFEIVEYLIKPVSQKALLKKDLNVKRYCTGCGSKIKPSAKWKFCPGCGEKI